MSHLTRIGAGVRGALLILWHLNVLYLDKRKIIWFFDIGIANTDIDVETDDLSLLKQQIQGTGRCDAG
jgi:hypothetical protein